MRTALLKIKGHVQQGALVGMRFKALIFEDYPNMKEKLISRLVMGALVGLAATGAYAGQIQSSSVSVAREAIVTDAQAVTSPRISYRFAGDVDARSQDQTFQVQFVLKDGALWNSAGTQAVTVLPATPNILVTDGVSGTAVAQGTAVGQYTVDALSLSTDKTTLYATITVHKGAGGAAALIKQPLISISSDSATPGNNPTIKNLRTVVGTVGACDTDTKILPIEFKHFVALSDPAVLASTVNATADEHQRTGSTNSTTLINFPTNIKVAVTKSGGATKIDVGAGNSLVFAGGATGGLIAPTFDSWVSTSLTNLGNVRLVQNASGYDSNLANQYLLTGNPALSGLTAATTSSLQDGNVEVKEAKVTVSASQGFVVGGVLFLSTAANCGSTIGTATKTIGSADTAGPITLTIPNANVNAAFGTAGTAPVHVCYNVAGVSNPIPGSAFTIDAAVLSKADQVAPTGEQDNQCNGPLYALSGSVKIDIRNYASNGRTDGWMSVIRLINNSETRTTSVWGQYIHADGKYGKWGQLATLAPRAVLNMTPDQVAAKLTRAPAHATTANNATADVATSGDAPRLRITSNDGNTLRVQNYLYNPASQNFIEASSSQGVDFTGSADRAPQFEGQYQDQDAQKGLNGNN